MMFVKIIYLLSSSIFFRLHRDHLIQNIYFIIVPKSYSYEENSVEIVQTNEILPQKELE